MNEDQAQLIMERLGRAMDRIQSELHELKTMLLHDRELSERRLAALEQQAADHEQRLREAQTGVTQFKVWSGLSAGSSSLLSLAAFLRSFFGV